MPNDIEGANLSDHDFCEAVGSKVEVLYDELDGDDMCFNLMEAGVIKKKDGVTNAVQIVAQHLKQP